MNVIWTLIAELCQKALLEVAVGSILHGQPTIPKQEVISMNRIHIVQNAETSSFPLRNLSEKVYLSIREWVFLTGIGRSNTFLLIRDNLLTTVKIGKRRLIPASELKDFFSREGNA